MKERLIEIMRLAYEINEAPDYWVVFVEMKGRYISASVTILNCLNSHSEDYSFEAFGKDANTATADFVLGRLESILKGRAA